MTLGTIGDIHCGQSPASSNVNRHGIGTPYVTGPEQWDGTRVRIDKWTTDPKRVVSDGCIFVTVKGAGVGKTFLGVGAAIGRDIYAFEPAAALSVGFVTHAIRLTIEELKRHAVGDIPGLSKSHLHDHEIGLPPYPEQLRIVSSLDSYFSRLDDAVASLERVQRNLKRYRASVLKAAVEGRLVPTEAELARQEGRDFEPADVLLKRILKERRRRWEEAELAKMTAKGKPPKDDKWKAKYKEPVAPDTEGLPELPDGWCWALMDQLLTHLTSGSRDWSKYYDAGDCVFLMAQNVRPGELDLSFRQHVAPPKDDPSRERSQVREGDLLVTIVGANTGDVCRVPRELPEHFVCQSVALMRPADNRLSAFLDHHLNSELGQGFYKSFMYGQGRPHLGFADLKATPVPLPPLDEQCRIAGAIEASLPTAAEVARGARDAGTRCSRLRQSILKWAFEGKLVDQDPTDEPASVLLERIRAERTAAESNKPKRKTHRKKKTTK